MRHGDVIHVHSSHQQLHMKKQKLKYIKGTCKLQHRMNLGAQGTQLVAPPKHTHRKPLLCPVYHGGYIKVNNSQCCNKTKANQSIRKQEHVTQCQ